MYRGFSYDVHHYVGLKLFQIYKSVRKFLTIFEGIGKCLKMLFWGLHLPAPRLHWAHDQVRNTFFQDEVGSCFSNAWFFFFFQPPLKSFRWQLKSLYEPSKLSLIQWSLWFFVEPLHSQTAIFCCWVNCLIFNDNPFVFRWLLSFSLMLYQSSLKPRLFNSFFAN